MFLLRVHILCFLLLDPHLTFLFSVSYCCVTKKNAPYLILLPLYLLPSCCLCNKCLHQMSVYKALLITTTHNALQAMTHFYYQPPVLFTILPLCYHSVSSITSSTRLFFLHHTPFSLKLAPWYFGMTTLASIPLLCHVASE